MLSDLILYQLATATSTDARNICRPFIRSGCITHQNETPINFKRGLLDTGAQGSNFIFSSLYLRLPTSYIASTHPTDRIVRLGDTRHLAISKEVRLSAAFLDSTNTSYFHPIWYSVLEELSHDLIIDLVDVIGPYYDLLADAVHASRCTSVHSTDLLQIDTLTDTVQNIATERIPKDIIRVACSLNSQRNKYAHRKIAICNSSLTNVIYSPYGLNRGLG